MSIEKKEIITGVVLIMGIAGILATLFRGRDTMPIEPTGQAGSSASENTPYIEPTGEFIFLQKLLCCDEAHAIEIATQFEQVTGKALQNAEVVPTAKKSTTLKTTVGDKTYYLKISSVNMLIEIREDSVTGNLIYQVIF